MLLQRSSNTSVTGFLGDSDAELINGLLSLDRIDRRVCREQVRQRFSVERMVEGYVQVYERQRTNYAAAAASS